MARNTIFQKYQMSVIHLNILTALTHRKCDLLYGISLNFGKRLSKILMKTIVNISEDENDDRPNSAPWWNLIRM